MSTSRPPLFPRSSAESFVVALIRRFFALQREGKILPAPSDPGTSVTQSGFALLEDQRFLADLEQTILRHRLANLFPLLFQCGRSSAPGPLPHPLQEHMKPHIDAHRRRALTLTAELIRVATLFRQASIMMLSVKGPGLGQSVFGSPLARSFEDLDLWIDPAQAGPAITLLEAFGYRRSPPFDALSLEATMQLEPSLALTDPERGLTVELHWKLFATASPRWPPFADCFAGREEIIVSGHPIAIPCRSDHLLYLAVHACKHGWERLSLLVDIAGLLNTLSADEVAALLETSIERGCHCRLRLACHLAERLFGISLPEPLQRAVSSNRRIHRLSRESRRKLLEEYAGLWPRLSAHLFFWKTADSARQALTEACDGLFRPTVRDRLLFADRDGGSACSAFPLFLRRFARLFRESF